MAARMTFRVVPPIASGTKAGPRVFSRLAAVLLAVALAGGCAAQGPGESPGRSPSPPAATLSPSVDAARAAIERALGERRVQLRDPQVPYRPAEPPGVARVPRAVYQAVLPDDPGHGFIVVYDLPTEAQARAVGEAQAAYVGSPVGRVQFPTGTQFLVRVLGSTAIFYADPPSSPDDQREDVVDALRTVGTEVEVPS